MEVIAILKSYVLFGFDSVYFQVLIFVDDWD